MEFFNQFWASAAEIVWGLPLVIFLIAAGIYFTLSSRLVAFRGARHAFEVLRGKFDNPDDPGEISHFRALTSALSATIGMGNIAGVAIAVAGALPRFLTGSPTHPAVMEEAAWSLPVAVLTAAGAACSLAGLVQLMLARAVLAEALRHHPDDDRSW